MTNKRKRQCKEDYKIVVSKSDDDNEQFVKVINSEKFKELVKMIITKYRDKNKPTMDLFLSGVFFNMN